MAPPFEQNLITHAQGLFVGNIKEFGSVVLEKKIFQRFCIKLTMFKLFLAIISPIM